MIEENLPAGKRAGEGPGQGPRTPRAALGSALAIAGVALVLPFAAAPVGAAPGDLIEAIPAGFTGPQDIAVDDDGTFWVTSLMEPEVFHLDVSLRRRLGSVPVPFEFSLFPFALGIAYDSRRETLLVLDGINARIHEMEKDGTPTGRVIAIPLAGGDHELGGMTYFSGGDEGAGSIFVVEGAAGLIYEIGLDGDLLRTFPDPGDPARFFGADRRAHPISIDLDLDDDGALRGFWVASPVIGLQRLDAAGRFSGEWMPLDRAAGDVSGLLRRPFPDPETGELRDTVICVVGTEARIALLEGGSEPFSEITRFRCEREGRRVTLLWSVWRRFDVIEVLDGCDVVAALPGDASSWSATIDADGIHRFSVRARAGDLERASDSCTVVLGAGEAVAEATLEGRYFTGIATDGESRLFVADEQERAIRILDLDLDPVRTEPVSEFFAPPGDAIGPIAFEARARTLFVYNASRSTMAQIDLASFDLIDTFDILLPGAGGPKCRRPAIGGMDLAPESRPGREEFLMVESRRDVIFRVDRSGRVVSETPHPYRRLVALPEDSPLGPSSSGIAVAQGSGGAEVYLSGGAFREYGQQRFFRMRLDDGSIVPGSEIPAAALGAGYGYYRMVHVVEEDGAGFLYVLVEGQPSRIVKLRATPAAVAPVSLLECVLDESGDAVELRFSAGGAYDAVEVRRDCERIALLDGASRRFADRDAPAGTHVYGVRGRRGEIWSDERECSLRTGAGGIVERTLTWPVTSPRLLARDPQDGSVFITGRTAGEDCDRTEVELHRFDGDLRHVESLGAPLPEPLEPLALAIRVTEDGESTLVFIGEDGGGYTLLTRSRDGEFLDQADLDPPRPEPPFPPAPAALMWSPATDTFFYLERHSRTIVEIDTAGRELRRFPHPAPPPNRFFPDRFGAFSPERQTILLATSAPDAGLTVQRVSRIVEIGLDGELTGVEIPIDPARTPQGIAAVGDDLLLLVERGLDEFVRIRAFERAAAPLAGRFVRGDADRSSRVNLTDAVRILDALFRGGPAPACPDAADANDDGKVNISDAIRILGFLFRGAPPPPPPFPEAAEDPTADGLGPCR